MTQRFRLDDYLRLTNRDRYWLALKVYFLVDAINNHEVDGVSTEEMHPIYQGCQHSIRNYFGLTHAQYNAVYNIVKNNDFEKVKQMLACQGIKRGMSD